MYMILRRLGRMMIALSLGSGGRSRSAGAVPIDHKMGLTISFLQGEIGPAV